MKTLGFFIALTFFLQAGSCEDDDANDDMMGATTNENFVEFLGTRYEDGVGGGCNVEDLQGQVPNCTYVGGFPTDSFNYAISIYHYNDCRNGTFNMSNFKEIGSPGDGNAAFTMTEVLEGTTVDVYQGSSGTIELFDNVTTIGMRFSGTVISSNTGASTTIEGTIICDQ